jgi:predicted nucleic acid-binding Zn ribbon protein
VEKLLHAPAVQFKGTGWYVTDYGGKSDKPKADGTGGTTDKKEASTKEDTTKGKEKDTKPKKAEAKKSKE